MTQPSYAVVLKCHAWDGFTARQWDRYRAACGPGDLFLYLDQTGRGHIPVPVPEHQVVRATNDDLHAIGLGRRFERGSLIWWNTDYPHYLFADRHPGYDYVLFVEYDTCCLGDIGAFVAAAAAQAADVVALPTRQAKSEWMWTRFHAPTYGEAAIAGSLNSISLYSARTLRHLGERRRAMADEAVHGRVPFWPTNEVFVRTETLLAGHRFVSLDAFGDVSRYEWHPPMLEADLPRLDPAASGAPIRFIHPVLDEARYIASLLRFAPPAEYFQRGSTLRRELARFPPSAWEDRLRPAAWARLRMRVRERAEGLYARLQARRATGPAAH